MVMICGPGGQHHWIPSAKPMQNPDQTDIPYWLHQIIMILAKALPAQMIFITLVLSRVYSWYYRSGEAKYM